MEVIEPVMAAPRPCTYAQRWLWELDSVLADPSEYNVYQAVRVRGRLDVARLRRAAEVVTGRHELLRTCYRMVDGRLAGVLLPVAGSVGADLGACSVAAALELAGSLVAQPFDLTADRPVRIWAIRVSDVDWVVVLCLHHITVDAWSMEILWRELGLAYNGEPLPPAGPPQEEIVRREEELRADELFEDDIEYWRAELADWSPLEIPGDRPRPVRRSGRGAQVGFDLPAELTDRLTEFVASRGSTVFLVVTAAVQLALARWTGRSDVAVGTVVAGRDEVDLESAVGYFVNTVVLRNRLAAQDTVDDFVGRVRDRALDAFSCAQVPFAELVERFATARDRSRNPIVDVMVTMVEDGAHRFRPDGQEAEPLELPALTAKFDLTFTLTRRSGTLSLALAYATDLFDAATAERFAGHVRSALREFCDEPAKPLRAVRLLDAAEHRQVVETCNDTAAPVDPRRIEEIFADWASRRPDAPAIHFRDTTITYGELDRVAGRLASRLRREGIGSSDRVAVRLGRTPGLVAAILGVLKAGAAYVPVDPAMPPERIRLVLADSGTALTLTEDDLTEPLALAGAAVPTVPTVPAVGGEQAYVIYTSGSTGRPKGVLAGHRGVVNLSADLAGRFGWGPGEVIAAVAPHSFDMSVSELISPLLAGAALRLVPREAAYDAELLAEELAKVTFAQLTPSHWQLLLDHGWSGHHLRAACGAEVFPPALATRLLDAVAELWNLYGPTETTVWSAAHRVREVRPGGPVPVGVPLANTVALILDGNLMAVPIAVPGELYLGGAGVAYGYHGAPGLTAERFVPDPFHTGRRLYRTGDVVRRLADGTLEFLSRTDDQVQVRGFRIEVAEVEAALERHPDVVGAAATAVGEDTGRRLVAFLVLRDGGSPAAVRRFVSGLLPAYLVPSALVPVDSLPLSPNGKVDRKQLPRQIDESPRPVITPRTDAERVVADAFRQVLGIGELGVEDDFFMLGGHSLAAVRAVAELRATFGGQVTVQLLFDHPTVESLAGRLAAPAEEPLDQPMVPAGHDRTPLSTAQRRFWQLDRSVPGRIDCNVERVWRLRGAVDTGALSGALRAVAARHAVLRSSIVVPGGVPYQTADAAAPALVRTEVSGGFEAAKAVAAADFETPFDLARGPLWRARLVRIAEHDHLLVLVFHHIVVDGGSFPVLYRDIAGAYRGEPLAALAWDYADYAREQAATPVVTGDIEYWRRRLDGRPATELTGDRPHLPVGAGRGAELTFRLDPGVSGALRDLARARGVTVFGVALAAFAVVLSRFSGRDDVVVGTPVSGRGRADLDELVGCFADTLVLWIDCAGDPPFRELLSRAHATVAEANEHRGVPFDRLVDELRPAGDASRGPLFRIKFTVPGEESFSLPRITAETVPMPATTTRYDLGVELGDDVGAVIWDTGRYDRETMAGLAACYADVLRAVAERPHLRLSELAPAQESAPSPSGWDR